MGQVGFQKVRVIDGRARVLWLPEETETQKWAAIQFQKQP